MRPRLAAFAALLLCALPQAAAERADVACLPPAHAASGCVYAAVETSVVRVLDAVGYVERSLACSRGEMACPALPWGAFRDATATLYVLGADATVAVLDMEPPYVVLVVHAGAALADIGSDGDVDGVGLLVDGAWLVLPWTV